VMAFADSCGGLNLGDADSFERPRTVYALRMHPGRQLLLAVLSDAAQSVTASGRRNSRSWHPEPSGSYQANSRDRNSRRGGASRRRGDVRCPAGCSA